MTNSLISSNIANTGGGIELELGSIITAFKLKVQNNLALAEGGAFNILQNS